MDRKNIAIIGGGPAGLSAAELLSDAGHGVTIFEAMPTVARKFLLAGKSGLNITHSEAFARFVTQFGAATPQLHQALEAFSPEMVRDWATGLGTETFVGSSGRVFPKAMKASPLTRAWLARLRDRGVTIRTRHRWTGFDGSALVFDTPEEGQVSIHADAVLLALGGASWPRLGSDAAWVAMLRAQGVAIADFEPANCGFDVAWSDVFREKFAGAAAKSVTATSPAGTFSGEFVITRHGIEGGLVYQHSAALRDSLTETGTATLLIDLAPGRSAERLTAEFARVSAKASFSNRLRKGAGLDGVKAALLREFGDGTGSGDPAALAARIKALPVPVLRPRPIAEAISSAGGIRWQALDADYMLSAMPGVFVAGEMIDWEAPTGGYLLTACFATGRAAARGIEAWLAR